MLAQSEFKKRSLDDISEFELANCLEVFLKESLERILKLTKTAAEHGHITEDLKIIEKIKSVHGCFESTEDQVLSKNSLKKFSNHIPVLVENYLAAHKNPLQSLYSLQYFNPTLLASAKCIGFQTLANISHVNAFFDNYSTGKSVISSIDFNMNDELFCTAGISKKIGIFDYASVTEPISSLSNSITNRSGSSD
jgi:hypothetical protein